MSRLPAVSEGPADPALACLVFEGADARHADALAACRRIRRLVFIEEQQVPEALEWDGLDDEACHFLVWPSADATGGIASGPAADSALDLSLAHGTARMRRIDGHAKAERVAVRREARRFGVGRRLMQALEERARAEGLDAIVLHAQVTAIPFYSALGYAAHGEIFLDAGIDHRAMTKRLR